MRPLVTQRTYEFSKDSGAEIGGGASRTRPNMNMSIEMMLHKFAVPPIDYNQGFTGEELPVDANRLDLTQLQVLRDQNQARLEKLAKEVANQQQLHDQKVANSRQRAKELSDYYEREIERRKRNEDGVQTEPPQK